MQIRLHRNATTTPRIRREIQQSNLSASALADKFGVTIPTIQRWRRRDYVEDASHTPHRLQTTLTPAQEVVVVELRRLLLLSLDDLLVVTREFINPKVSRSGLDRCLRRHGVSRLADLKPKPDKTPTRTFKDYEPGFVHIDIKYLPQMPDEDHRKYLFVAIDRASRWVCVEIKADKSARSARAFVNTVIDKAPFHIKTLLTDNDKAFTDRITASGRRTPTGNHPLDELCAAHNIDHRLIPVRRPQTNGMVERFNGRISEVLATTRFNGKEDLKQTLKRYVTLYNDHIPQQALHHQTPIQTLKDWQRRRPELFHKRVIDQPGRDTYERRCKTRFTFF